MSQTQKRQLPTGAWVDPSAESSARWTIESRESGVQVSGVDQEDGEVFEISDVSWDGSTLEFTSRMPSTGYVTEHEVRFVRDGEAEFATTRRTIWRRQPFT